MVIRTYFEIGMDDREWASAVVREAEGMGYYNQVIMCLQQAAEKYLKGYISENLNYNGKYDKALKTHNLRLLANIINNECGSQIDPKDAKYLGDFYYDARYPGDNYEYITDKSVMEECFAICDSIIVAISTLISREE